MAATVWTRRKMVATGGAMVGALGLAACGGERGAADRASLSTAPVTVRAFIGGLDAGMMDRWNTEFTAPFKQIRPNVTIELISQSAAIQGITTGGTLGVVEKLVALIAGGEPPDINDLPRSASWQVQQGFLDEKLDGFVKRDKYDTKQFNQREFNARAVYQGKVWQIPFKHGGNALGFVVNRDRFQAEGLPVPGTTNQAWDWNAFVEVLTRLTKRTGTTVEQIGLFNYGWHLGSWPLLWQADWVSEDGKRIICDSAEMQDCYTKFNDLFNRHQVVPRPGEATTLLGTGNGFLNGKAAMAIFAPGSWGTYFSQDQVKDIAIAPMPRVKITTPDVNVHSLGIIKGSKNQEHAWEVIKFLNDGGRLARFSLRLPASVKDIEPWAREQLVRFPNADPKVVTRAIDGMVPQINLSGHKWQDDMLRVLNPAMEAMLQGKEAPVTMLRRLKPELQAIVDRG